MERSPSESVVVVVVGGACEGGVGRAGRADAAWCAGRAGSLGV